MADNVRITPGVGTIIETIDEGSGVERQVIAIGSIGKSGSETQLTAGQKTSANSIPIVIASDQSAVSVQQPDNRAVDQTINSATLNAAITVTLNGGEGEVGFTITGLTASTATLTFEGCNNIGAASPQWGAINAVSGTTLTSTATGDGSYRVEAGGRTAVRVRVSSTGTGTITVSYSGSSASSLVTLAQSLPTGSNTIGAVNLATTSPTDRSGTITLGGSAQTLMSANSSRHGFFVQNQSNADLWINDLGSSASASQPSIWLPAGAFYTCDALSGVSVGSISIFGNTTSAPFAAREW